MEHAIDKIDVYVTKENTSATPDCNWVLDIIVCRKSWQFMAELFILLIWQIWFICQENMYGYSSSFFSFMYSIKQWLIFRT